MVVLWSGLHWGVTCARFGKAVASRQAACPAAAFRRYLQATQGVGSMRVYLVPGGFTDEEIDRLA
jgi:hypothetical protein